MKYIVYLVHKIPQNILSDFEIITFLNANIFSVLLLLKENINNNDMCMFFDECGSDMFNFREYIP